MCCVCAQHRKAFMDFLSLSWFISCARMFVKCAIKYHLTSFTLRLARDHNFVTKCNYSARRRMCVSWVVFRSSNTCVHIQAQKRNLFQRVSASNIGKNSISFLARRFAPSFFLSSWTETSDLNNCAEGLARPFFPTKRIKFWQRLSLVSHVFE